MEKELKDMTGAERLGADGREVGGALGALGRIAKAPTKPFTPDAMLKRAERRADFIESGMKPESIARRAEDRGEKMANFVNDVKGGYKTWVASRNKPTQTTERDNRGPK